MEAGILSELFQPVAKIRKGIIHVLVVLSINQHKKGSAETLRKADGFGDKRTT